MTDRTAPDASSVPTRDAVITGRFLARVESASVTLDDAQRVAVGRIVDGDRPNLYLWGPVGRGKSMLAELYLGASPPGTAVRWHLNELFRRLQAEIIRDWRAPAVVLRRLLTGTRVLLIDEFHVHDVADAVYLDALLRVASEEGIALIATSNYPPDGLLPDPLHHHRFSAAISRIHAGFDVVEVGAGPDHRARGVDGRARFASGAWRIAAADPSHRSHGPGRPVRRSEGAKPPVTRPKGAEGSDATSPGVELLADGIPIRASVVDAERIRFTFAQLCIAPVGVRQYQWIADRFETVELTAVPDLAAAGREPLMRFTSLVDVLYDHDVRLEVSAVAPFARLVDADRAPLDAARALSRLGALRG